MQSCFLQSHRGNFPPPFEYLENLGRLGSLRPPEPHAWIGISRGIDVRPLTPSLSPSDGERVPFRAGEGSSAGPPSFHGLGCLSLGAESALPMVGSALASVQERRVKPRNTPNTRK